MLSPRLLEVLRACWRATHPQAPGALCQAKPSPDEWFFHSWRQGRHMNVESLQTACREAACVAGLSKHVTVHRARSPTSGRGSGVLRRAA